MRREPETIAVAAVRFWSITDRTPAQNRVHTLEMLEQWASTRPDLFVMPEAVSMLCPPHGRAGFSYRDVMEAVPGPTTDAAAAIARHYGVNLSVSLRARAVDNALPVVAAGMRDAHNHNGSQEGLFPTCIIDPDGEVIAQFTAAGPDIVVAQVSNSPVTVDHLGLAENGVDWKRHRPTELRPALYAREDMALSQRNTYYRGDER